MPRTPTVSLRVYSDDCDAYGHANQATFLRLFERARWEALAEGPGMDAFTRGGAWPAIRRAAVEYFAPALPGDTLEFDMSLIQVARRKADRSLVATGHFLAVCINRDGRPMPVPDAVREYFGTRPGTPVETTRQSLVRGTLVTAEMQGDGEWVLFIHGFPFDRTMWRGPVTGLRGWGRVAPDLSGFGLSDARNQNPSIADYADDIAATMEAWNIDAAVMCGLSMGGYVAFELWRRHQRQVRGLILTSTRAEADTDAGKRQRGITIQAVREQGTSALVEGMLPKLLTADTLREQPAIVSQVRSMILDTTPDAAISALAAMRERADSTDLLGGITVPALVIGGAEDSFTPADGQREMAGKIPGARLEIIPRAAHMVPLEQPGAFTEVLESFLRSC
jgi:pimeloyl-ACP methyl ester carboxylesterase